MNDLPAQLGRLLIAAAGALLLLGGCGGGGSPAATGEIPPPQRPAEVQAAGGSPLPYVAKTQDEKRIYRTATALREAFDGPVADPGAAPGSASSACAAMSERMRRHVTAAAGAAGSPGRSSSCRRAVAHLIGLRRHARHSRIVGIAVTGDTAVAELHESDGGASEMRLVREGGRWKVTAPGQPPER